MQPLSAAGSRFRSYPTYPTYPPWMSSRRPFQNGRILRSRCSLVSLTRFMLPGTGSSDTLSLPSVSCLAFLVAASPYGQRHSAFQAAFFFALRGFRLHAAQKPVCAFSQQIPACLFFLPSFFPDQIICLWPYSCKLFLSSVHEKWHLQTASPQPQVPKKRNNIPLPSGSTEKPVIGMGTIGCSSCPSAYDPVQESFFPENI